MSWAGLTVPGLTARSSRLGADRRRFSMSARSSLAVVSSSVKPNNLLSTGRGLGFKMSSSVYSNLQQVRAMWSRHQVSYSCWTRGVTQDFSGGNYGFLMGLIWKLSLIWTKFGNVENPYGENLKPIRRYFRPNVELL